MHNNNILEYTGVEILTLIQRVPMWWIGESPLDFEESCEY